MWKLFFPHLMITPKLQREFSSCSRGCKKCNDNLSDSIHVNVDPKNPFYLGLQDFFSKNELIGNKEVTFLYYWDFSKDFFIVQQGIQNLFDFQIIPINSNIWVWIRCNNELAQESIEYIRNWKWPWELRLKFSMDLSSTIVEHLYNIKIFFQTLRTLSLVLSSNIVVMLQLNNIELLSLSIPQKKILFSLLQSLCSQFRFLNIQFSDYVVNTHFDGVFKDDFFSYEVSKKCVYIDDTAIDYTLDKNFLSDEDIYIEHVDIFEDAISIHNLHCKKLLMNNFGSIYDTSVTINKNIRKFHDYIYQMEKIFDGQGSICNFCKKQYLNTPL